MKVITITPKNICNAIEELLNENEKLYERLDDYKNRIEKALKFIEENKCEVELDEYLLCNCLYDKKTIELINILQGSDKE